MRRFITIFVIVLLIALVVLGGLWLSSRNTATKNGTPPLTFREFVTGKSAGGDAPIENPDALSSDFNTDGTTTGTTNQPTNTPSLTGSLTPPNTQASIFTNEALGPNNTSSSNPPTNQAPITPSTTPPNTTSPGSGTPSTTTPSGPGSPTTTTPSTTGTGPGTVTYNPNPPLNPTTPGTNPSTGTPTLSTPLPECSDADLNIIFTPQELAELKTLEGRFYTVAESIRTDEDVAREVSNHDTFKIKGDQISELYNYCTQKTPYLANPLYTKRVATPFWNSSASDTAGFVIEPTSAIEPITNFNDLSYGKARLVHALRLNLW